MVDGNEESTRIDRASRRPWFQLLPRYPPSRQRAPSRLGLAHCSDNGGLRQVPAFRRRLTATLEQHGCGRDDRTGYHHRQANARAGHHHRVAGDEVVPGCDEPDHEDR